MLNARSAATADHRTTAEHDAHRDQHGQLHPESLLHPGEGQQDTAGNGPATEKKCYEYTSVDQTLIEYAVISRCVVSARAYILDSAAKSRTSDEATTFLGLV